MANKVRRTVALIAFAAGAFALASGEHRSTAASAGSDELGADPMLISYDCNYYKNRYRQAGCSVTCVTNEVGCYVVQRTCGACTERWVWCDSLEPYLESEGCICIVELPDNQIELVPCDEYTGP